MGMLHYKKIKNVFVLLILKKKPSTFCDNYFKSMFEKLKLDKLLRNFR